MTRDDDLPDFMREALELEANDPVPFAESLVQLVPTGAQPPDATRLLAAVETLPLRYAPFFDRLATLWDLAEADVVRLLERAGEPSTWRRAALPGVRFVDVTPGPRLKEAQVRLARFRPGLRFPRHRHDGPEALLVLEGRYRDQTGRSVGPGECHAMGPGSEHALEVDPAEPCVVATVQFGMHFTGPLLRVLSKVFG